MKTLIRIGSTLLTAILMGLTIFTTEIVVDEIGWPATVRAAVRSGWSVMIDAGYSGWLIGATTFLAGASFAMWADYFARRMFPPRFKRKNLFEVRGKTFRHQEVVIDGKKFVGCVFEGVTLVYQGTGNYGFERNKFLSTFSIRIDNDAAMGGLGIAKLSQHLGIPIQFEDGKRQSQIGNEEETPR